jgi:hypothetical protein
VPADNVPTPTDPAGPAIATDEVGSRHFQLIKQTFGPANNEPTVVDDALGSRHPVKVGELLGATSLANSSANVTTGGGNILATRATRRRAIFTHRGSGGDVWLGAAGVAVGTGAFLPAIAGASQILNTRAAVDAIADGANASIGILEEYD